MNNGIQCTLSKLADDAKEFDVVDMLEGRDAIQSDLDGPGRWASVTLMRFKKAKCKVLHLGWEYHKHSLRGERIESSPGEKDFGVLVDTDSSAWPCNVCLQPRKQRCPGLHQKQLGQKVKEGDSTPLLHPGEIPPGVLHPVLEVVQSTEKKVCKRPYRSLLVPERVRQKSCKGTFHRGM
ncbi:rna-directed dna polymerase from mobile element jockey-like [Pitangus sulphuratus]|nr:rna-directed dna polymerase from mobile element jockey-like [Pitangus sulphuratus]